MTEREIRNQILKAKIKNIFDQHKKRYGAIRIKKELFKNEGLLVSINNVMPQRKMEITREPLTW